METQVRSGKFIGLKKIKRKLFFFLISSLALSPAYALLNTYNYSVSTATLDPMTSGTITTLIAANIDDGASAVTSIGFSFVMNGTTYTQFSVNSNGLLRLGATVVTAAAGGTSSANSLLASADFPKITAYWDNLKTTTTTGSVRSKVNGSSPNRILVVDWQCTIVTAGTAANFQVWLYEGSNNIRFVYNNIGANSTLYSVGMAASTTANDVASVTIASPFTSSTNSNSSSPNNSNTLAITSGNSILYEIPPACAGSLSPASSATNISITPTLSWAAGTGASSGYDVYFGTSSTPPRVVYNQAGLSYSPGTLAANTIYYWKIVARNDSAQAAGCSTIQFTTAAAPGCATLVSPAASATNITLNPTLSWTAGTGSTTGYDVYFGTASNPPLVSTNQATTSYTPAGPLTAGTVYYWRVVPQNLGAYAICASINQFTTAIAPGCPTINFPSASATNITLNPTLTWTAGTGSTTGYDIYFGTAASPPLVLSNQASASYTPTGPLAANTIYYWRIVPQNLGAYASGCSVNQFTTVVAPGCAASISPTASQTGVSPFVVLSWTPGTGTTTGYDVYFGTTSSPSIVSTNQAGTTYTPSSTLANNTIYYWKVQPRNGGAIATCSVNQFTTAAAPGCAGSLSPASAATNVSVTPTLSWAAGSGTTTGYDVYLGTTSTPPVVSTNQPGTTYLPGTLNPGTVYYWKVIPQNNGAYSSGCSALSFTTLAAPGCANNLLPATGSSNLPVTQTLSWTAGSGTTTSYNVYFGTSPTPPLVSNGQTGLTYNPGTLSVGTTYYWQIVPRNGGAMASGCPVNSFATISAPGCITGIYPDTLDSDIPINAVLSWTAGSGVTTGYDVYFGTASNPPLVSTNQAGTTYTPATMNIATNYYWKVIPRNGTLLASGCPVNEFTTILPPGCVSGVYPSDSGTDVSPSIILSWAPGLGNTTAYDVYFGTTSNPPLVSSAQAGTTYTPPANLSIGTIYYWMIVPRNNQAAATGCSVYSFTTAFPPGCVTNISPANSTTNISVTPVISWSPGTGNTTQYDVYFGTSSNPPLVSTGQFVTNYTPGTLAASTLYYWKVVPQNSGAYATGCTVSQFTTVVPPGCAASLYPAASATGITPNVQLSWAAGTGITTAYDVYFGTAASPPLVSSNQVGTTYSPGLLSNNTVYYWKIIPHNGGAYATCSAIQFTTAVAPGCTGTPSPAASATGIATTGVTLSWVAGTGTTTGYDVYFGLTNPPPLVSTNQPGTTYIPGTMFASTVYYWKVLPQNIGAYNTTCSVIQFTTVTGTSCANNFSPANLATNLPLENSLSWTAGPGNAPTAYDVYFGTSSTPPLVSTAQAGTTYNTGILNWNTTYYWKVVPRTGSVLAAGCSTNSFSTGSPLSFDVTRTTGISYSTIASSGSSVSSWRNGTNTDDNLSNAIPIGFNFNYAGTNYSNFLVSTNGFITFNTSTSSTGNANNPYGYNNSVLSSGSLLANPTSPLMLAPLYDDLTCQGGQSNIQSNLDNGIKYQTTGSPGSRVLTVEWIGLETYNTGGPNLNFQVKLYEGSNNIDFVYGTMEGFNGTFNLNYSYSLGLNGPTISSTAQSGEFINQLIADTRDFGATPTSQMTVIPACNSKLHFTPGAYTPYVPVSLAPSNDNVAGAIMLNVNPTPCTSFCGTYYSSANATNSGIPVACVGSVADDDVWFDFYAVNPVTVIKVLGGGAYDPTIELFDSSLHSLTCANTTGIGLSETITTSNLVIGAKYYFRVYHKGSGWGNQGSGSDGQFSVCISGVAIPPSNDDCANSITLPVSTTLVLGTSTVSATASAGIPSCSASGVVPDDDVWYKFTAIKAVEIVTVVGQNGFNAVIQLFSGTCNGLVSIACVNNYGNGQTETLAASGLTIGNVYYVRVFHAGIGGGTGGYSISVSSPAPPCAALMLPPDSTFDEPAAGIILTWQSIPGADNYKILMDTVNPPLTVLTVTTDTSFQTPSLFGSSTYYWQIVPGNGASYTNGCHIGYFIVQSTPYKLHVKAFLQSYYTGNHYMAPAMNPTDTVTDTITINLYDDIDSLQYSYVVPISRTGDAVAKYPINALGSDYYLAVTQRNHVETWSKNMFTFNTDTIYDFTVADTMAYGNNQVQVEPGVFAFYCGDLNQDGAVDSLDLNILGTSASMFNNGFYLTEDLNGDKYVESTDLSLIENVVSLMITRQYPFGP